MSEDTEPMKVSDALLCTMMDYHNGKLNRGGMYVCRSDSGTKRCIIGQLAHYRGITDDELGKFDYADGGPTSSGFNSYEIASDKTAEAFGLSEYKESLSLLQSKFDAQVGALYNQTEDHKKGIVDYAIRSYFDALMIENGVLDKMSKMNLGERVRVNRGPFDQGELGTVVTPQFIEYSDNFIPKKYNGKEFRSGLYHRFDRKKDRVVLHDDDTVNIYPVAWLEEVDE